MTLRTNRESGAGTFPQDACLLITYDDVSFEISTIVHQNNNPTWSSRAIVRNAVTGQEFTDFQAPLSQETFNLPNNRYFLSDDNWAKSHSFVM